METPQASPAETSQDLTTGIAVTLTCKTTDAKMYYTLDGSEPGAEKTLYSAPVDIQTEEASKTLKAVAVKDGMEDSDVLEITYTNSAATLAEADAANVVTAKAATMSTANAVTDGAAAKPVKKTRKRAAQKKE